MNSHVSYSPRLCDVYSVPLAGSYNAPPGPERSFGEYQHFYAWVLRSIVHSAVQAHDMSISSLDSYSVKSVFRAFRAFSGILTGSPLKIVVSWTMPEQEIQVIRRYSGLFRLIQGRLEPRSSISVWISIPWRMSEHCPNTFQMSPEHYLRQCTDITG